MTLGGCDVDHMWRFERGTPEAEMMMAADAPGMPVVQAAELTGEPFTLESGRRYTIGWQRWPGAGDEPAFVILRRSWGFLKVVQHYPLTEEGWQSAWHALASRDRAAAEHVQLPLWQHAQATGEEPNPAPPPEIRVFHKGARWPLVAIVVVGSVVALSFLIAEPYWWQKTIAGLAFAGCVATCVRIARFKIIAGPDGLVVHNFWRTVRIGWQEIDGFAMPTPYGAMWNTGLRINLTGGRMISATAYSRGRLDTGKAAAKAVAGLTEMLDQYRQPA